MFLLNRVLGLNSIQYVVCLHKYSNFCYLTGFTRNLEINRTDFWVLAGVWGLGLVQRQSKDPHKHLRRNALQEQLTAKRCSLLLQSSRLRLLRGPGYASGVNSSKIGQINFPFVIVIIKFTAAKVILEKPRPLFFLETSLKFR